MTTLRVKAIQHVLTHAPGDEFDVEDSDRIQRMIAHGSLVELGSIDEDDDEAPTDPQAGDADAGDPPAGEESSGGEAPPAGEQPGDDDPPEPDGDPAPKASGGRPRKRGGAAAGAVPK